MPTGRHYGGEELESAAWIGAASRGGARDPSPEPPGRAPAPLYPPRKPFPVWSSRWSQSEFLIALIDLHRTRAL